MQPESPSKNGYLEDTSVVDWQTPRVFEKGRELARGAGDEVELVRGIYTWVRDEIAHSCDIATDVVTCTAGEVLREGTGLCFAKSHLLAALLRRSGVPAGFCYQRLRSDRDPSRYCLHGFNAAYLSDLDRWVPLDARGNSETVAAEFDPDEPRLAYTPDAARGEEGFATIFSRPLPRIVDVLQRAPSLEQALANLPDSLA